jgi:hypothetical protein
MAVVNITVGAQVEIDAEAQLARYGTDLNKKLIEIIEEYAIEHRTFAASAQVETDLDVLVDRSDITRFGRNNNPGQGNGGV